MNWKITLIPLLGISLATGNLHGQSAAFLETVPDARAAALGGSGTALTPDAWSVYWNVAKAAAAESKAAIAYSYSPWMKDYRSDSYLHRIGGYYRLTDKDALVAGFRYFANGNFELTDNDGVQYKEVNPYEYAIEIGYARTLIQGLSAGATIRYIHSDMGALIHAEAANAVAFDLGLYYQMQVSLLPKQSLLSFGLTMSDLGSRIEYADSKYALPTRLSAGAALSLPFSDNHILTCSGNALYRVLPSDSRVLDGGVGLEYNLYKIGYLRAGYRWSDIEKNAGGDYVSVGLGVKYWHVFADASWRLATEDYDPLDKTFTFSVGFNF